MSERIVMALILIVAGMLAYRVLLLIQHRAVSRRVRSDGPGRAALLVFTSPTCAPCKLQQLPIIKRLMVEWSDKIEVRLIDVTGQPDVARQYGVWSLPTTIVLKTDRNVVAINQGVANEQKLREQFERATVGQPVNWSIGQSVNQSIG